MRKAIPVTIAIFFVAIITIVYFTAIKDMDQDDVVIPNSNNETVSWKSHNNEQYGIEFKYPEDIVFTEGSVNSSGWYNISANYEYLGDNYFNFTILDKKEGMENINSLKYRDKNLFASNELYFQNGKFIQADGYGTANYYFVDVYYEGENYVYHFMMSRPNHSKELLELFEKILSTAVLKK
jgi:hypothetical protein